MPPAVVATAPPGVLGLATIPWSGGPAYYKQFSKAAAWGWTSPSFFPIMEWDLNAADAAAANGYKALGINTLVNIGSATDLAALEAAHLSAFADPDVTSIRTSPSVVAYTIGDETDGLGAGSGPITADANHVPSCTTSTPCGYTAMSYLDSLAPPPGAAGDGTFRYMGYTTPVLYTLGPSAAAPFVNAYAEAVAADKYWYTAGDCGITAGYIDAPASQCHLAINYGANVDALRNLETPGHYKPVYMDVELSCLSGICIQPGQVGGAVWASIIHGALGIVYFPEFAYCGAGDALLGCPAGDAMHQVISGTDSQIEALAPVINTPSYSYRFNTGVDTMLKYSGGSYYVFSMLSRGSTPAKPYSFTLPPGLAATTVTVLNENRSLPVAGSTFTDSFAQEYTDHIYKITPGA